MEKLKVKGHAMPDEAVLAFGGYSFGEVLDVYGLDEFSLKEGGVEYTILSSEVCDMNAIKKALITKGYEVTEIE